MLPNFPKMRRVRITSEPSPFIDEFHAVHEGPLPARRVAVIVGERHPPVTIVLSYQVADPAKMPKLSEAKVSCFGVNVRWSCLGTADNLNGLNKVCIHTTPAVKWITALPGPSCPLDQAAGLLVVFAEVRW